MNSMSVYVTKCSKKLPVMIPYPLQSLVDCQISSRYTGLHIFLILITNSQCMHKQENSGNVEKTVQSIITWTPTTTLHPIQTNSPSWSSSVALLIYLQNPLSTVLQKLIGTQLVRKFPAFSRTEVHDCIHTILPLFTSLSNMNPAQTFLSYLLNPLKSSGNYLHHLLQQSITLHLAFFGSVWFSVHTAIISLNSTN